MTRLLTSLLFVSTFVAPAWCDMIGTSVTGVFNATSTGSTNLFAAGPVTIADPLIEFSNGATSADFTGTQLIITDHYVGGNNDAALFTFTDSAFSTLSLSLLSNNYPAAPTYSLGGNLITINFGAVSAASLTSGTTYAATFNLTPTPEPANLGLLLIGFIGIAIAAGRRRLA